MICSQPDEHQVLACFGEGSSNPVSSRRILLLLRGDDCDLPRSMAGRLIRLIMSASLAHGHLDGDNFNVKTPDRRSRLMVRYRQGKVFLGPGFGLLAFHRE